jgi:hypothetical protein
MPKSEIPGKTGVFEILAEPPRMKKEGLKTP